MSQILYKNILNMVLGFVQNSINKITVIYLLVTFSLFAPEISAQDNGQIKKDLVRMGALPTMMMDVDLKDANAAFKIWTDSFVKKLKTRKIYDFTFEYTMYEKVESLEKDIKSGYINYFNVSAKAYFDMNLGDEFIPFLSGTNSPNEKFVHYLLITSNDNSSTDIKQVLGKKINISRSNESQFGSIWIKSLLRDELGAKDFKSVNFQTINQNENEDLLSVFFGKSEYALVSDITFDVACELNPAVKKKIKIIRSSDHLLNGVFVYRRNMNKNTIKVIQEIVLDMPKENEGKQILSLFKIQKIVPITQDDLYESEKVVKLYNKYFKNY